VTAESAEGYPTREDRIVAEFGDGHDVEGIALRYGLTVAQVYAVVESEVGPAGQGHPGYYSPQFGPNHHAPPAGPPGYYPPPPGTAYYGPPAHQAPPPGYGPPAYQAPPPSYGPPAYQAPLPGYGPPAPQGPPPGPGYDAAGYQVPPGPGYGPSAHQAPPAPDGPPNPHPGPGVPLSHGVVDEDAIVADYGAGHDVESIARQHGVTAERVYEVVQRILADDAQPPTGPAPSW
jgi:hypothetical protein